MGIVLGGTIMAALLLIVGSGGTCLGTPWETAQPPAIERLLTIRESLRQTNAAKNVAANVNNAITLHDFLNGSPNPILQLIAAQLFAANTTMRCRAFPSLFAWTTR